MRKNNLGRQYKDLDSQLITDKNISGIIARKITKKRKISRKNMKKQNEKVRMA